MWPSKSWFTVCSTLVPCADYGDKGGGRDDQKKARMHIQDAPFTRLAGMGDGLEKGRGQESGMPGRSDKIYGRITERDEEHNTVRVMGLVGRWWLGRKLVGGKEGRGGGPCRDVREKKCCM